MTAPGDVQLEGVDLTLAVGAGLNRAGSADQVAHPWERAGTQAFANVDRGQARQGYSLRVGDDEVGVAVAVGVDPLDEGDSPLGAAAAGQPLGAARGSDRVGRPGCRGLAGVIIVTAARDDEDRHRHQDGKGAVS